MPKSGFNADKHIEAIKAMSAEKATFIRLPDGTEIEADGVLICMRDARFIKKGPISSSVDNKATLSTLCIGRWSFESLMLAMDQVIDATAHVLADDLKR